jgi:hypothetical protein
MTTELGIYQYCFCRQETVLQFQSLLKIGLVAADELEVFWLGRFPANKLQSLTRI